MSRTVDITKLKREAVDYFNTMPKQKRLDIADWIPTSMSPSLSSKLGNLYYGIVRIWIIPNGNIFANKPGVSK